MVVESAAISTQTGARAGIVNYWFQLRGTGRDSYENARLVFGGVIVVGQRG